MRSNGYGRRVSGLGDLAAFEFFGTRSAYENCGHVWLWRARMRTRFCVVSTVCCAESEHDSFIFI